MGWGSYRMPASRPVSSNVWQQKGETMSLKRACAAYGVTEEQCMDAKLEMQWRTSYGNSFAVVKVDDVMALKRKLKQQEQEAEEQRLIEKHGVEGLAKIRQEEKERAEEAARQKERAQTQAKFLEQALELARVVARAGGTASIEGDLLSKTACKKDWFLKETQYNNDFTDLRKLTRGKTTKYELLSVISASEKKLKLSALVEKLDESEDKTRLKQYSGFLKMKLDQKAKTMDATLVAQALQDAKAKLNEEVVAAEKILEEKKFKAHSFEAMFDRVDKENATPASKRLKSA